jgi:DNA helicase-2/ATP-dependent DNA helicase PcrA
MELTEKQRTVMKATGHLLVMGGPGSGKTTISILKAAQFAERDLRSGQKILFLSFARATVSRVLEAIDYEHDIPAAHKRRIDVETYHSFFWRILKAHGYLIGLPRRLHVLTPPDEAIALSEVRSKFPATKLTEEQRVARQADADGERLRLARDAGRVCFDLYAPFTGDILHGSSRIRRLVATMYPYIILDEFQDTNGPQWRVVQALGELCKLLALADPEQRIFDWIGADPARLDQFRAAFTPDVVDLSTDNHRSAGTEIAKFGNDVLAGQFRQKAYIGVQVESFTPFAAPAMTKLVTTVYAARKRLLDQAIERWSVAILLPTKRLTRLVSDALRNPPAGMAEVHHVATLDMEAAILGAEVIAVLLQPAIGDLHVEQVVELVCNFFRGKGGDEPTRGALQEAEGIRKAHAEFTACRITGKSLRKNSIFVKFFSVYAQTRTLSLTGIPDEDWHSMRRILQEGACVRLQEIAEEVRNVQVLGRGTYLRQALTQDWRDHGEYRNALAITRQAFMQEHFSTTAKPETGVVVMNMHKAKGKQFDEVIIFEGWPTKVKGAPPHNPDRIVRFNSNDQVNDQARQTFRVSVTRAKRRTTILTPQGDPCVLLGS